MAIRVDKLEKLKLPQSRGRNESQALPAFNQTIIINNPNIHINYLHENQKPAAPLSTRGIDNWNLNNNLKQFSQTRQLGFFKQKKEKNKSNSPYIIHKIRTQDLKSLNKIFAPTQVQPFKETLSNFRKNETISHIVQPSTIEIKANNVQQSPLQKIISRHDKTVTHKFYQAQMKKEMPKNFQTLPTNYINTSNPEVHPHPKTFRRNRFQIPKQQVPFLTARKTISKQSSSSGDQPQRQIKLLQKQDRLNDSEESQRKIQKLLAPRIVPLEMRRRAFNKTIAKIDQALLSNTDDYFERIHAQKLPQTKIELLVNSVSQPEQIVGQSSSKAEHSYNWGVYDFEFQQERKKRPKTPKRKKQYEQEDEM